MVFIREIILSNKKLDLKWFKQIEVQCFYTTRHLEIGSWCWFCSSVTRLLLFTCHSWASDFHPPVCLFIRARWLPQLWADRARMEGMFSKGDTSFTCPSYQENKKLPRNSVSRFLFKLSWIESWYMSLRPLFCTPAHTLQQTGKVNI